MTKDSRKTEQHNADRAGAHKRSALDNLTDINNGQVAAIETLESALPAMAQAVEEAAQRLRGSKGRIIYIGAGTPGRLGVQDGVELKPTYGWLRVAFAMAGGRPALLRSMEGAEDDRGAAVQRMADLDVGPDDVCIAVSASGTTPYTVAACEEANRRGALTIGIASNDHSPLLQVAAHKLLLDSGAEPVAGSTRMNAGTAQKAALNMLSTATMIALGRVYDGYMVFVQPTCDKLVVRSKNLIQTIGGCDEQTATQAFNDAEKLNDEERRVPTAILAAAGGLSVEDAAALLKEKGDHFGEALEAVKPARPDHKL